MRPVGAKLKFHRNFGNDAHDEADAKDFRPEPWRAVIEDIVGPQIHRLQNDDERGQSHGELREEVMKRNGESEAEPMHQQGIVDTVLEQRMKLLAGRFAPAR